MRINIGENLKKMRLSKDLTQEQLAEVFGVSPQAISRSENNTAYPDITMIPGIAVFYNTTIDELMGMGDIRNNERIHNIHVEVPKLVEKNKIDDAIELIRDGLKLCPNDYGLLSVLAQTLSLKINDNNDSSLIEESITLLERALQGKTSIKAKSTIITNLIFLYLRLNEVVKANELIKSLPHIWECREVLIPEIYDGDEYVVELKKSIKKALIFFNEKIKAFQTRKFAETPRYIQLGVDFEVEDKEEQILDLIRRFLIISN